MTVEEMTEWLREKKPRAQVEYAGPDEDGIFVWHLRFPDDAPPFHVGVPGELLGDEGGIAERLMEAVSQGWFDAAGEEEHWIVLTPDELVQETGADEEA